MVRRWLFVVVAVATPRQCSLRKRKRSPVRSVCSARYETLSAVACGDCAQRNHSEVYSVISEDNFPEGGLTAKQLMDLLEQDPAFRAGRASGEAELEQRVRRWREAEQPLVEDLRREGVCVDSVWDLVNTSEPYPEALAVLMAHLERDVYPDRVREGIARALAVIPASVYWDRLRAVYQKPLGRGAKEGVAVALAVAVAAAAEHMDAVEALVRDEGNGESRVHFVGAILRIGGMRGRSFVESLRSDPVLGREASALLSK